MSGQISAALVVMGAMFLFAGSAVDRAGAQTLSKTELIAAGAQENGQQVSPPPQNPDDTRRDDGRRDDARRDEAEDQITIDPAEMTADQTFLRRANA